LGEAFAGRVAASLLHALGLDELIAGDTAQYLERAAYLAESPPVLSKIRGELAARRDGAMFCTARYCRHLEAAFLAMHERRTRGERPQAFIVPG
jgi:predicted O-linked N-acetylglucosamine transferase (SPINDLY family)